MINSDYYQTQEEQQWIDNYHRSLTKLIKRNKENFIYVRDRNGNVYKIFIINPTHLIINCVRFVYKAEFLLNEWHGEDINYFLKQFSFVKVNQEV